MKFELVKRLVTMKSSHACVFVLLVVAVTLLLLVLPSPAWAMMEKLDLRELAIEAESVVMADVVAVSTRLDAEGVPLTEVRFSAKQTLSGGLRKDFVVQIPGGRVGDLVTHVTGQPSFGIGDRVILFLDSSNKIVGGRQGRLGVHNNRIIESGESLAAFATRLLTAEAGLAAGDTSTLTSPGDEEASVSALSASVISAISPSSVPGGAGHTVVLTGTGFGASAGKVEFSHGTAINSSATILRWSDTRIEVVVPDSVSSGPVRVRTAANTLSTAVDIHIPYTLGQAAWVQRSVPFSLSSTMPASWQSMVRNGAISWNGLANFAFAQSSSATAPKRGNRVNEIWWGDTGTAGHLAIASISWFRDTDNNADGMMDMVETDMIFSSEALWGDGSGGTFDIQSVALHEFGHWLSLDDLDGTADAQKAMFGRIMRGQIKRSLAPGDQAGIRALYGDPLAPAPAVVRIAGTDRYRTAVEVSRETFAAGSARTVVLATGRDFADALSASGLAGAFRSPLLLTSGLGATLEQSVRDELVRLGAEEIVIIGGEGAVSSAIESSLGQSYRVRRIGGNNRYHTAALVASEVAVPRPGSRFSGQAFIARGDSFADALSAAPLAYSQGMPILLVLPNQLPEHTAAAITSLGISSTFVVGGEGAVGTAVTSALPKGVTWKRIAGTCRFTTAEALLREARSRGWTCNSVVGVATGQNFPDALGGGAAAGARNGAILLTRSTSLPSNTAATLFELTPTLSRVEIFGGSGAVCNTVSGTVSGIWGIQ